MTNITKQTQARSILATAAAALGLSLGLSNLAAQTAPAASGNTGQEAAVKLDPFSVSAQSDVGFVAANSLAGGRIATALKDTPVAYSVLTSEFLEAFNINDTGKAADFSVNTNQYQNDGLQGVQGNTTVVVRIRGQPANTPTRNFFPYNIAADSYNVDRIDFARGANASLFGAGGSAGTVNTVTKQALTSKTIRDVKTQVGSWQRYRFTADFNQPLTDKIAIRTNLLWSDGQTWREREWERRKGIHFAATWDVTSKFSMRAEYEFRTTDKNTGTNRAKDNTSGWDGMFMPSGVNPAMTAKQMNAAGVVRQVQRIVVDPDNPRAGYNMQNFFVTRGAAYNSSNPMYLNGKQIRSVGVNIGSITMTEAWDHPDRFAASFAGSPYFRLPHKTFTPLWDVDYEYPSGWERAEDVALYLTYRPFDGLFVEWSGDYNGVDRWTEYPAAGGMYNMQVDINRTKPDGSPNPYFLQPYSENTPFAFEKDPYYKSSNLQIAYVKDTRWGKLQAGVMAGIQNLDLKNRQFFYLLPLQNGVFPGQDMRAYFEFQDMNKQSVYTRQYTGLRGKLASPHPRQEPMVISDYQRGTRAVLTPHWYVQPNRPGSTDNIAKNYKFLQTVANLNLFKNRLVLIGAFRRDLTLLKDELFIQSYDEPAGWDGYGNTLRPSAPADYYSLEYTPKNAAGVATQTNALPANQRPRNIVNGVAVASPQYANDRFQDDFSPPDIATAVNTRTIGAVVNITSWLGIFANDSTTFDLNAGGQDVNQQLIPGTTSQSYDAGIRFHLPNGKMNVSLGWYRAFQKGRTFGVPGGFRTNVNTISDTPVIGDLSEGGRNVRGLGRFPGYNVVSTRTSETTGYEAEMTANLTSKWRMIVNVGTNKPMQKDVMPDVPAWIKDKDPVLRQILADGGIQFDSNNQAFINPALNDPALINVDRVQTSVSAWNTFVNTTVPDIQRTAATESREANGPVLSANIATDYRFTTGRLNGLRAGIGIQYRGRQVLGAMTGDTIADPNNPNQRIPAPYASATSYLWAGGYTMGTANFSYTYRLKEANGRFARYSPKTIQFDLAIDNLFGLSKPLLETSRTGNSTANSLVLAPRDNDVSNVGVMSIPGAYNFQPPRSYMVTAKFSF